MVNLCVLDLHCQSHSSCSVSHEKDNYTLTSIILLFSPAMAKKNNDDVMLTTTFLVVMSKEKSAEVTKTLKKQGGVYECCKTRKHNAVNIQF